MSTLREESFAVFAEIRKKSINMSTVKDFYRRIASKLTYRKNFYDLTEPQTLYSLIVSINERSGTD